MALSSLAPAERLELHVRAEELVTLVLKRLSEDPELFERILMRPEISRMLASSALASNSS